MEIIQIVLIITAAGIYGGLNYYIGLWGFRTLSRLFPFLSPPIYWPIFWFIVFSFVITMLFGNHIPTLLNQILARIGYYWMAAFLYFLLAAMLLGLIKGGTRLIHKSIYTSLFTQNNTFYINIGVLVLVLVLFCYGTYHALHPSVTKYPIVIHKNAGSLSSLKIVFLSDIHIGEIVRGKRIDAMVDEINHLKPDIILLGGDTIDSSPHSFIDEQMKNKFNRLRSTYGTFAILGNHEYYLNETALIEKTLSSGGIKVLRDETIKVGDSFYLVGREDLDGRRYGFKRKSMDDLLKNTDLSLPILLLDHQPPKKRGELDERIDLMLSGHTHKGQIFPNNLFTSLLFLVDYGYKRFGQENIIVSSGYGTWGPPLRIGSKAELVEIDVQFK